MEERLLFLLDSGISIIQQNVPLEKHSATRHATLSKPKMYKTFARASSDIDKERSAGANVRNLKHNKYRVY